MQSQVVIHQLTATLENYRTLVAFLAKTRKILKIRQIDLAENMGTSQSGITEIEKGVKDQRLSTILRYAEAMGVQLDISVSVSQAAAAYLRLAEQPSVTPEMPNQSEPWQAIVMSLLTTAESTGLPRPKIRIVQSFDSPPNSEADVEIIVVLPAKTAEPERQ